mgnify:CR=1 FL=1
MGTHMGIIPSTTTTTIIIIITNIISITISILIAHLRKRRMRLLS